MPPMPAPTIPMAIPQARLPVSTALLEGLMPSLDELYRMTVDEYERLANADVLDDRRVELIGGYLVKKMTTKPPHVWAVDAARENLDRLVPVGWDLREEKPVRIPDFDEPEPDLAIVSGTRDDYANHHPGPGEIGLLVEVADSSLAWDRGAKLAAFARAGIPVYWIINLIDRHVEVYTGPRPDGSYSDCQIYRPGDEIPVVIAGSEAGRIAVADTLPPNAAPAS
jgi:Uma2 family endonuclease